MIFISYRKEDSIDFASALAGKLIEYFGEDYIFFDSYTIEPGAHWQEVIDINLSKAVVVLAVIGSRWLTSYNDFGQRRIDLKDDVLAYELSMALKRKITVIPLYLRGQKPLPKEALPDFLTDLSIKQGIENFDILRDFLILIDKLGKISGILSKDLTASSKESIKRQTGQGKPWCIPDSIGLFFKGRNEAVLDLRNRFLQDHTIPGNTAVLRQVIFGLGGIGKTRLAIEYAWEFQESYSALLFTVADTPAQLHRSIAELAVPGVLNLHEWESSEEKIRMAAVIRWLSENNGWLLIIDNADEDPSVEAVQNLLPQLRNGHVLITSRNHRWSKSVTTSELDILSQKDAKLFLLDRTSKERRKTPQDEAVAEELARELDGLALALEQAGAYIQIRDGGLSLADYLARWRESGAVCSWCDQAVMQYNRSVAITWETTVRALSPAALSLFRILSWFAPDPVPRLMFSNQGIIEIIKSTIENAVNTIIDIDPELALSELIAYSMTKKVYEQGISCVGLHRVVLQIMREHMPKEAKELTIVAAAKILVLFAPIESYRPETWMDWRLLISHAEAIWMVMHTFNEEYWNIELMKMLALYYMGQDRNDEGVPIQREVLRLVQKRLSPDDPEIFLAKNDLALMLDASAEDERESLYQEALDGRYRVLGVESEAVAETLHNYGCFLHNIGRVAEGEPLIFKALEIHGKINGPFHWRTLMAESSLAEILLTKGEVAKAETLIRSSLQKKQDALGKDHPDTLSNLFSLASLLERRADHVNVEQLLTQIYEAKIRVFGLEHPSSIDSLNNLASFFCRINNCSKAEFLFKQALETTERAYGLKHYHTFCALNQLAGFYAYLGDAVLAEPLYVQAIEGMRHSRGADHPDTLSMISNLASLLSHSGQRNQAEALFKEVMEIHKKVRGSEHQMTISSVNRLAIFYDFIGDEKSAEKLYRHALQCLEEKRGADHRDTLTLVENLAELLRKTGDHTQAEILFRRIVDTNERLYGPNHLMTFNSVNRLAVFYTDIENYSLAKEYYERALEGKKQIQGSKHPDTLLLMSGLAHLLIKKGEYAQAEDLLRTVMEINEHELGQEHPNTLSSLLKFADLLEKEAKIEESLLIRDRYIKVMLRKRDTASLVSLRELALQFFHKGEYNRAEELLLIVLARNFQIPGVCCHLARLYILMNREADSRQFVAKAWTHRNEAEPYMVPRILFFQALFLLLDGIMPSKQFAGLKFLLKRECVFNEWKIKPVLDHLTSRLSPNASDLLNCLSLAISECKKLSELDRFPEWIEVEPAAIE